MIAIINGKITFTYIGNKDRLMIGIIFYYL